jgi:hypothetical protein
MNSTSRSRLAGALLAAATIAALPASAHANTAELTVNARSADGTLVYPQPQPDGSSVLAVPHDGVPRTIRLDASGTVAMYAYSFDVEGNGVRTAAPDHGPYLDLAPAFDHPRTSTAYERGGANLELSATASLRWLATYQPTVHLAAPALTHPGQDVIFDASDATAWNADGSTRPVARYEWELPDTTISTAGPRLLHRFDALGPGCLTVRAVDVTGAQSEPSTACTTVARPVTLPTVQTQASQPVVPATIPTAVSPSTVTAPVRPLRATLLAGGRLTLRRAHVTAQHAVVVQVGTRRLPSATTVRVRLRQSWGNGTFRVSDVVTRSAATWRTYTLHPYSDTRPRTTEIVAEATAPDGSIVTATTTIRLP